MLSEDVKLVEYTVPFSVLPSGVQDAWQRIKTALAEGQKTPTNTARGEICHDDLHFRLGVIPGTNNYRCYNCGWEGKLSPVR